MCFIFWLFQFKIVWTILGCVIKNPLSCIVYLKFVYLRFLVLFKILRPREGVPLHSGNASDHCITFVICVILITTVKISNQSVQFYRIQKEKCLVTGILEEINFYHRWSLYCFKKQLFISYSKGHVFVL